jgi:hypothetical protein
MGGPTMSPSTPRKKSPFRAIIPSSKERATTTVDPNLIGTPSRVQLPKDILATPTFNTSLRKIRRPRTGKKTQAAAEKTRREVYAQELFTELNRVVFNEGLPKDTKLNWNKRLLTTAGRAKWHR